MDQEGKSRVDDLNETLYSRTRYKAPGAERSALGGSAQSEAPEVWQGEKLDELLTKERELPQSHPFMKKFFYFALFFFVVTLGVAGFMFFGGNTFISSKNVEINVLGPTSASAGETLELGISVVNKNNAELESAVLSIQYPAGTREATSFNPLTLSKEELGSIRSGSEAVLDKSIVLIGAIGEIREFKLSVEYKVKGSNAVFFKEKIYEIIIGESPVSLNISSSGNVTSGENFTTTVTVTHNSTEILRGVMLRAEYPYGFSVSSVNPSALAENNVWFLGDLSPGDRKVVSIRGALVGEDREQRTFRFYTGVSDSNGSPNPNFQNVIVSSQNTVAIERPSIALNLALNGESVQSYVAPVGRPVVLSARFQNNTPSRLLNPKVEVRLTGAGLDRSSVSAQGGGVYSQNSGTATWLVSGPSGLPELAPGSGGQVSLTFASPASISSSAEILVEVIFTGVPVGSASNQALTVSERRTVKISSEVNLSSRSLRSTGPFFNEGPVPPKVAERSTYTIIFNLGNTRGDILDGRVMARLGPGVEWVGASSFESESISFEQSTGNIVWEVGPLASGTGFSSPTRQVAFQVALTPTTLQLGTAPTLVSGIVFSGLESATRASVSATNPPLTTRLSSDPAFIQGDDIVVR